MRSWELRTSSRGGEWEEHHPSQSAPNSLRQEDDLHFLHIGAVLERRVVEGQVDQVQCDRYQSLQGDHVRRDPGREKLHKPVPVGLKQVFAQEAG